MPMRLLKASFGRVAAGIDRTFAVTAINPSRRARARSPAESLGHLDRIQGLAAIEAFYAAVGEDGARFFPQPEPIAPEAERVRSLRDGGRVVDLSWDSQFEPLWSTQEAIERVTALYPQADAAVIRARMDQSASFRDKYLAVARNRRAHARWYRHPHPPRATVVIIHGYMTGDFAIEERLWPVRRLYRQGMDVVLTTLPFHGRRRDPRRGPLPPRFPSGDPRFTIEGFRQMVFDHRALFDHLIAERSGPLGLFGMSLGGYSAALLATIESRLAFDVLFIPLAAIDRFAADHGRMVGSPEEQLAQTDALRAAQAAISPLARKPLLSGERIIVIGGTADRVTGMAHSEALAQHFGGELVSFAGGHLLQVGREQAFEPAWTLLRREGYLD
jgi:hypothetical protein